MKKGELISKGAAFVLTLGFMAVVRPDPEPSRVEAALVAILMYEVIRYSIRYIMRERGRRRRIEAAAISKADIQRWADEWIVWPLKEVS